MCELPIQQMTDMQQTYDRNSNKIFYGPYTQISEQNFYLSYIYNGL